MARHLFAAAAITVLAMLISSMSLAQTKGGAPAGTKLGAAVKGTFKEIQQSPKGPVVVMDSGGRTVYALIDTKAKTSITGIAEPSFLATNMYIKFEAVANGLGEIKDPLTKLTVCEPTDIETPAYSLDDPKAPITSGKPTKEQLAAFYKYFIRGTIRKVDGEDLTIQAPNVIVKAKIAPAAKIDVQSKQYHYAQSGDDVVIQEGSEFVLPAPPAAPAAKGKAPAAQAPAAAQPRYISATWLDVTAKAPLVGKKKPGQK